MQVHYHNRKPVPAMIAEELGINRSTAWRALKKAGKLPVKATRTELEAH